MLYCRWWWCWCCCCFCYILWGPTTLLFTNTYAITPASCYTYICCDCDAYSLLLYIAENCAFQLSVHCSRSFFIYNTTPPRRSYPHAPPRRAARNTQKHFSIIERAECESVRCNFVASHTHTYARAVIVDDVVVAAIHAAAAPPRRSAYRAVNTSLATFFFLLFFM